jgi:hypothetical protein
MEILDKISVAVPKHGDFLHETVRYKIVLPSGYDPAKTYPAILAFGGGQTMNTVDSVLNRKTVDRCNPRARESGTLSNGILVAGQHVSHPDGSKLPGGELFPSRSS